MARPVVPKEVKQMRAALSALARREAILEVDLAAVRRARAEFAVKLAAYQAANVKVEEVADGGVKEGV